MSTTPTSLFKKLLSFSSPRAESNSLSLSQPIPVTPSFDSKDYLTGNLRMEISVLLMGKNETGKSAFLLKSSSDIFQQNMQGTIGTNFEEKKIRVKLQKLSKIASLKDVEKNEIDPTKQMDIILKIWDTNGHQSYKSALPAYVSQNCKNKMCVIFYDVSDRESFLEVQKYYKIWAQKLEGNQSQKCSVLIVANKIDLQYTDKIVTSASMNGNHQGDQRQKGKQFIGFQQGLHLAKKLGALFVRSSSVFDVSCIFQTVISFKLAQQGFRCRFPQKKKQQIQSFLERSFKSNKKSNGVRKLVLQQFASQTKQQKRVTPQMKQKMIQYLKQFQLLKTKSKSLNFEFLITKYMKALQMKICIQQKTTNLKTITSSLHFLSNLYKQLQQKYDYYTDHSSHSDNPDQTLQNVKQNGILNHNKNIINGISELDVNVIKSQIQALNILKKSQELEIVKVSKAIGNNLKIKIQSFIDQEDCNGNQVFKKKINVEEFWEFREIYEKYKIAYIKLVELSNDSSIKELDSKREIFQTFFDTVTTYLSNLTTLTEQLLAQTKSHLTQPLDPQPLSTPTLLTNLLQYYLYQKSQQLTPKQPSLTPSQATHLSSLTTLLQKKQELQIIEGMNKKDEKYIQEIKKILSIFVKKIEQFVQQSVFKNGQQQLEMEKWVQQYNKAVFGKCSNLNKTRK